MPKLYYTPTSCGAASFIAAHIAGVQLDVEQVDLRTHTTSSGADFYKINVKGNVPALVLEDGTVLNEGAAVLQYIADQVSAARSFSLLNTKYLCSYSLLILPGSRKGCS
jgi:glutathione S-transferase